MGRRAPVYEPLTPRPCDLPPERLAADGAMSRKTAAAFLGVSLTKLKALLRDGTLPFAKAGGRVVVMRAGCQAYLEQLLREQAK